MESLVMAAAAPNNPILPNATFIAELVAFVIILVVLAKWVIPPINKALTDRQERIKKQFADLDEATERANATEHEYRSHLSEARHEAARIRAEAHEEGQKIIDEATEKAKGERDRILKNAEVQLAAERQQVIAALRQQVGDMATVLAGRIVGESLDDHARQSRTVERFIAGIDTSTPSGVR